MVGFEHMEWKSRCADRFISMYGYKATHKYYEDGREHTYHYAGCVLPDVPFHGESETGFHSGS